MNATRLVLGATSLSSSNHLPVSENSTLVNPVTLPPGRARLSTKRSPTGSETTVNTIGIVRRLPQERRRHRRAPSQNHVGLQRNKLLCKRLHPLCVASRPAIVNPQIAAFRPT